MTSWPPYDKYEQIKFKFIKCNELTMIFALTSQKFVNAMSDGAALKMTQSLEQVLILTNTKVCSL